jgi:hypothetical protein
MRTTNIADTLEVTLGKLADGQYEVSACGAAGCTILQPIK